MEEKREIQPYHAIQEHTKKKKRDIYCLLPCLPIRYRIHVCRTHGNAIATAVAKREEEGAVYPSHPTYNTDSMLGIII